MKRDYQPRRHLQLPLPPIELFSRDVPAPVKNPKNISKKHLRPQKPLVSSRSISPLCENGGYGATDN
jgi:hypothetical protein